MGANAKRSVPPLALAALAVAGVWAGSTVAVACVEGDHRGDAVTVAREAGPTASGQGTTLHVVGAGWFRAAEIVKQGGSSDRTYVTIEIDGEPMITTSFATLKNQWNQLDTPYIIANVRAVGSTSTMTIWYSPELKFRTLAALRIDVQEDGVEDLRMRAVLNRPAPHEHLPGQPATALALPAFQ